jgi:hypothetical protein
MQGLGATGAQQSKDCSFGAGYVPGGAPLRISWFLVIFFVYQLMDALQLTNAPLWVRVARVTGNEFILLLTVLTHEMGHGTMAKKLGGDISQVLLWPFGGICFSTRPPNRSAREKLVDDLKIVAAGPATHFPQSGVWFVALVALNWSWQLGNLEPTWKLLVPFSQPQVPCFSIENKVPGCVESYGGFLLHGFLVQAIQLNVMLFLFNVFFPMYPMDGAKLIVCSLQLFCGTSAKTAAKVLIGTSGPLAVFFIGYSLKGGASGGGMMQGVGAYMGVMCLMETYKIYSLLKQQQLHHHPLFESARSDISSIHDSAGVSQRLNDSSHDDAEAPKVVRTEMRPFAGTGISLGTASSSTSTPQEARPNARNAWLDRMDNASADRQKSVQQLQDERLDRGSAAE